MSATKEPLPPKPSAPSAILDHMRRRIGRVGLLVVVVSSLLAAAAIFLVCACANLR
jgi:hypothetical protein